MWCNFPLEYPAGKTVLAGQKVRRVNIYLTNLSFTIYPMGQVGMLQNFNWKFHFSFQQVSPWNASANGMKTATAPDHNVPASSSHKPRQPCSFFLQIWHVILHKLNLPLIIKLCKLTNKCPIFLDYTFPLTFSHKYTRWSYLPQVFVDCD